MSANQYERLVSETAEERTARLQQMSANQHERLVSETAVQREARLQSLRDRLASETAEERTTRLQQMSANQHERLTSEIAEERTARLQQTNTHQRDRLVNETAEEREARLQYYSDRHRELQVVQSHLPLFEQRSVRTKMLRFHAHMASLNSPQCATCSERFPGLRLCSLSTECVRCSHDKHSPKVYSAAWTYLQATGWVGISVSLYTYTYMYMHTHGYSVMSRFQLGTI